MNLLIPRVCAIALTALGAAQAGAQALNPKDVVTAFYDMAFVQGKAGEAARKFISPTKYVQHNPQAPDGRDAFINGFGAFVDRSGYRCQLKRVVAEGDLVAEHGHCKEKPSRAAERGSAVMDIFRVENGLIVEHWDVEQPVPAKAKNRNTMF